MSMLYSPSMGSCYIVGMHQDIPGDAIEISDETFSSVIGNPPENKVRAHMPDGTPYLVDREKGADELACEARAKRNEILASTDWLVSRHRDEVEIQGATALSVEQFASLLAYRQALRDFSDSDGFPAESAMPETPGWLAALAASQ